MSLPQTLYHAAARARRRWFERHPESRRTLAHPVVSVGNLTFGGSGKTPLVGAIATLLRERGERPAILSRGYARRRAVDGVVLVSDGDRLLADLDRAGDEPLMLARSLPGVIVLAASDRHLAGRLAELRCDATVHILDDGFQHLGLARDVDLLVLDGREAEDAPTREDPATIDVADAVLVARGVNESWMPAKPIFHWWREIGSAVDIETTDKRGCTIAKSLGPVAAVAGIAVPERFFTDLRQIGVDVRATLAFADHHAFTDADLARIGDTARAAGCEAVLTTEKDATRLRRLRPLPIRVLAVPLRAVIDPSETFPEWLIDQLAAARARRRAA